MKRVLMASAVAAALVFGASAGAQSVDTAAATEAGEMVAAAAPEAGQRGAAEQRRFRLPSERVEARISYLRTALKITDAQSSQFDAFANVLRKHARDMDQRMEKRRAQFAQGQHPQRTQVSAIERLERTQSRMTERSARLGEVINAAKPLYASFSPEQKQIADEMLTRGGRGGHHRGHGGHHGRGMHRGA